MNSFSIYVVIAGSLVLILTACSNLRSNADDKLLAQVFDKRLYMSEVQDVLPQGLSPEDSLLAQNAYTERWIRENVMMHEAEKNIPPDLKIDDLVKDYESSLIMHQYEKSVVETLLDTLISDEELEQYYEENKSQYQLESTIVRCHLIKVPQKTDEKIIKEFEKNWKSKKEADYRDLVELCNQYASTYYLSDSIWYKLDLISQEMPIGSVNVNAIRNNRVFQLTNDDYYYFLKILEIRDKKEIAPLAFIQEQAAKVILHKRKLALLERLKEDLYQRASARNNIKIYLE
ncbi:MAG: hypothetical protein HKN76_06005 [Saprospiraceae bacterium]|nr:hypothetical protein [Saprospiraceae bacterium]